jgi:hypothetical protein
VDPSAMVLPFSTPWLVITLCALIAINYKLLHNKLYFMVDCAFMAFLGSLIIAKASVAYSSYTAKIVLDIILLMLCFATMRILLRRELYDIFRKTLSFRRRMLALACVIFLAITWLIILQSPRPFVLPNLTATKSNLKNMGTALEMYSTDHKGAYPATLDELTPNYLKTIPLTNIELSDSEKEYYEKKYNLDFSYTYEVDNNAKAYTISCQPVQFSSGPLIYTSREGLMEH